MTKADLKTGMVVKHIDDSLGMVLLGTRNGDIVSGEAWYPLSAMEEDLTYGSSSTIVAVYQPNGNRNYLGKGLSLDECDLLWKREEEKVEMTLEQVCEALGKNIKIVKS